MVITGGYSPTKSSTELLDLSKHNSQWQIMEELRLPIPLSGLKGATIGSDFYISGGYGGSGRQDKIMKLSCNNGQCQLETLAATLQVPRFSHIFLPLPASMAVCD